MDTTKDGNDLLAEYQDTVTMLSKSKDEKTSTKEDKKTFKESTSPEGVTPEVHITQLYPRRWLILGIFCLYSMSSAFQWIEYSILTSIVTTYYDVGELAVAWTSMIYMATYIPLMFVATWMLENWGLRKILLFGAALNAAGALIKLGSLGRDQFYIGFIGQTVAACAQSFILEIPPKIASLWFGKSECSTATSIGVFGNQLGVALGFLIPPMIVPGYIVVTDIGASIGEAGSNFTTTIPTINTTSTVPSMDEQHDSVQAGFKYLFIISACLCSFVFVMIFMVIRDQPPLPPSDARAVASRIVTQNQAKHSTTSIYITSIKDLFTDVPYFLLFISYGVNTGVYYAIGTLLNSILIPFNEGAEKEIGQIGLTMICAGLGGSLLCGMFLDKTQQYKYTTIGIYCFTFVFMVVFAATINFGLLWLNFITIGLLGFFMTGYLPIGFEFAAEITFPISEAISSGLLNVSAQVFGIIFTLAVGVMITNLSVFAANCFMCVALFIGCVMTCMIKTELKRQNANQGTSNVVKSEEMVNLNANNSNSKSLEAAAGSSGHVVSYARVSTTDEHQSTPQERDDAVLRLASTSSCYSAGGEW